MVVIGYARASTDEQDLARQLLQLKQAGVLPDLIFQDDAVSGARDPQKRPGYSRMLGFIQGGTVETLMVSDLSRLGRDARGTLREVWDLQDKKIALISLSTEDKVILSADPVLQPLLYAAFTLGADIQRKKIIEDTRAGMARARAEGREPGRPSVTFDLKKINELRARGLSERSAVLAAGYKLSTFYAWKKKNGQN
ncbi:MAG: recombinase family protein [Methanoregulaceae archaeon]